MSLSPKLLLRQSQSLVMTPQLMQAIKLLQLSSMDLQTYIAQEIEQNPLLERADSEAPAPVEGEEIPESVPESLEARDGDWMEERLPESRADIEERLDADLGNVFQDEAPMAMGGGEGYTASAWSGVGTGGEAEGESSLEAYASPEIGLADHLDAQLALLTSDPALRLIGRGVIDCIDETGYLSEPLPDIAARLGAPLKRTDCSPLSDGAAAMVLADADTARTLRRAVRFRAAVQVNDYLPLSRRDPTWFEAGAQAWSRALDAAALSIDDLSLVETHDCFTIAELIEYEVMGLAQRGKGAQAAYEGWTQADGKLPVNRSGGLKSKGHPVGATGVSMHIMAAMQLVGEAGDMQLPNADFAGVYNMGGTAVANYVSILERMQR